MKPPPTTVFAVSASPPLQILRRIHGDGDEDDTRGSRVETGPSTRMKQDEEEDPSSLPPLLQWLPKGFCGPSFDDDGYPFSSDPDGASLSATVVFKNVALASA